MSKQKIAIDIDEVLSPLHDLFFAHHNEVYGTNFPLRDPGGSYFISHYTGDSEEMTEQKIIKFITTEAFKNNKPLEKAVEVLSDLKKDFDLMVITSRQDFYFEITHEWLEQHFPKLFKDIYFTGFNTGTVSLKTPKSKIALENGATYLIEDNLENATESAEAGLKVILFGDYPWNQAERLPVNMTRCKDWQEVLKYFEHERSR